MLKDRDDNVFGGLRPAQAGSDRGDSVLGALGALVDVEERAAVDVRSNVRDDRSRAII